MHMYQRLLKLPSCLLPLIMASFLLLSVCGCNAATVVQPVEYAGSTADSLSEADQIRLTGMSRNEEVNTSPVELFIVVAAILLFAATTIRDN